MANHKNIERICIIIAIMTLIIGFTFSNYGEALGIISAGTTADLSYTTKLFDDSKVHTIDITISAENWNDLQDHAADEAYEVCDVTVDGEILNNVAIRPKGNSSLSSVVASDSERYSFKIDFDKYTDGLTYHGLDKLNLNNIISDNTYLKDYLSYDMMNYMGVDAPLTSFVRVSVNGEYFGLYLAVEGVEAAFVQRNYGSDYGNIYKPDNMDMGGGDQEMPDLTNMPEWQPGTDIATSTDTIQTDTSQRPEMGQAPNETDTQATDTMPAKEAPQTGITEGGIQNNDNQAPEMGFIGNLGGASGDDVALIYSDDELSSYDNIWDGAVFDVTTSDKERLIEAIKQLNEGENLEDVVNVEEVLKYFVVHNFVDNYDSYTGSMKHNYYLREDDGQMSIIAWDYNLAFSNFAGIGGGVATATTASTDEATTLVNYPIDTPVSGTTMEERPLLNELLSNDEYRERYHQYFQEFISGYFESGRCSETIDKAVALISADVAEDPTKFCTYEEYQDGVAVLKQFCDLRAESISGQLDGSIPATKTGQTEDSTALIDASSLNVSVMGNNAMDGGKDWDMRNNQNIDSTANTQTGTENSQQSMNGGGNPPASDTITTATMTQSADGSQVSIDTGEATTIPGNLKGNQNDRVNPGGATGTNVNMSAVMVLIVSVLLLIGGILATKLYKH
ncbi:CotH kinase family protein [Acetobacterium woodii]|uniref:Spore coat protein CotH n=1 Tax=Acetobacterium woodii (strain ATCC 29683 / DSM 1030 / JCM 2381 / KCTC 1655 / WB1) TaxID=931626 RepID=H6LF22_ACEWD|nr:CotH kinase family protein [Acetobacterium woodii]AFA46928.1 spore coat protein CotH [Acetobacterium woodii DSM 1030]